MNAANASTGKSRMAALALLVLGLLSLPTLTRAGGTPPPPTAPTVERYMTLPNGQRMHYLTKGNAAGKPLLLIHGWPTSNRLYEPMLPELCNDASGPYYCIAPSHIGFGKSSCPGGGRLVDPAYEVDRLAEFIDLIGITNYVLVVHDWGGIIGTGAAMRHPECVSHLVVLNTFLKHQPNLVNAFSAVVGPWLSQSVINKAFAPIEVETVMQVATSRWLWANERADYSDPYRLLNGGACRATAGLNLFAYGAYPSTGKVEDLIAARLTGPWAGKPAIFLWGEDDLILGPNTIFPGMGRAAHEYMESLLPQASTVRIPGANHFMQEDKPAEIAAHIWEFLENNPD